jgi:hypothetical protein
MNYLAEFERVLQAAGANELAARVLTAVRPGVVLQKRFQTITTERPPLWGWFKRKPIQSRQGLPVAAGSSRLGGLPELPAGTPWPSRGGKPMQLLAQINCAELVPFREHTLLPAEGTLHFFMQDCGEECLVTLTASEVPLLVAAAPAGAGTPGFILPQFPVRFAPIPTLPHPETKEFAALGLDEGDAELVLNALGTLLEDIRRQEHALHGIGGYPEAIQGDVWTECEMGASRRKISWKEAAEQANGWKLLLQFETDGDLNVMWGDAGTVYFCIREDDLRAGRFDKVYSTMQCG